MVSPSWHFVAPLQYYEDHGSPFLSTFHALFDIKSLAPAAGDYDSAWGPSPLGDFRDSQTSTLYDELSALCPYIAWKIWLRWGMEKRGCFHGRDAQSERLSELVVEVRKLYGHFRDMMGGLRRSWFVPQRLRDEMQDWMERCDEVFGVRLVDGVRVDVEQDGEAEGWREDLSIRSTTRGCIRS